MEGAADAEVPILRNIAVTFPYFHDGSASDLGEAMRIMATFEREKSLTVDQIGTIRAFLLTLTGEYRGTPVDKILSPAPPAAAVAQEALPR